MGVPAKRRATYDDLLRVDKNLVAEIIDGELVTQPRPASLHARASSRLGIDLGGPFDRGKGGPGGWILLDEPELHLHGDVLAPDWVCEVLSPATAATDRAGKMPVYAREGVRHIWLVDPVARTLEAYRLESGRWVLVGTWRDDAKVHVEPFEVLELELGGLWAK